MTTKKTQPPAPLTNVFGDILETLAAHKARSVQFDYNQEGHAIMILFWIDQASYRIPVWIENKDQYQIAWGNFRDWINTQFALIETEATTVTEVFLPYLYDSHGLNVFHGDEE